MGDFIDDTTERSQRELDAAIAAARRPAPTLNTSHLPNECANGCGTKITGSTVFCSVDCRDDHEKLARMRRINGN